MDQPAFFGCARRRTSASALQFFLKAYVKVGLGPFSMVFEDTLAKTSGFKEKLGLKGEAGKGTIGVATHSASVVACRDALDVGADTWDPADCKTEYVYGGSP